MSIDFATSPGKTQYMEVPGRPGFKLRIVPIHTSKCCRSAQNQLSIPGQGGPLKVFDIFIESLEFFDFLDFLKAHASVLPRADTVFSPPSAFLGESLAFSFIPCVC